MKYSDPFLIQATERALTWRVIDPSGCTAFLKCHRPGQEKAATRELAVLGTLRDNPHVSQLPTLIDTFTTSKGERVIVTTWVPGNPLGRRILMHHKFFKACPDRENCRLPEHQAIWTRLSSNAIFKIITQLVEILGLLHTIKLDGEPLFHGDIAPWNLHWTGKYLYLVDLGCDNAVHPFFELPPGEKPSPAGDVYQVGRLIEFLAPRLAKLFPELRENVPEDRPTMERVAYLLKTRERSRFPVFQSLGAVAILVLGFTLSTIFNKPQVEHRIGRQALEQTLAENPGHAVAVVDGRHEIEAIISQPTWSGRDRIRQLMIARPADLSMEYLANAMDNVNIVLGFDEGEVTIMGGCFDPPQLWVDCSWLQLGDPLTIRLGTGRGARNIEGVFCGLNKQGPIPRISLFQDGNISTHDLPMMELFDWPMNLTRRYFFYPGNSLKIGLSPAYSTPFLTLMPFISEERE